MRLRHPIWLSAALILALALPTAGFAQSIQTSTAPVDHVLLISVDGLHTVDMEKYIKANPTSTLAALARRGVRFTSVTATPPTDSFPGLMDLVTGGSAESTGVYYETSYDRTLVAPAAPCTPSGSNTQGTVVTWSEAIDLNPNVIDGGGGIDTTKLPQDPVTCARVYPHSYLAVNTIFEVIKSHLLRTAWSDKSLGYEIVNGPSGNGVDDLYTPEINAPITVNGHTGTPTSSETFVQAYDTIKVNAIINEIDGYDHARSSLVGTPAAFGMNFQSVSVGQKLEADALTGAQGGYLDAQGNPSPLLVQGLDFVDQSLGRMVAELKAQHQYDHTAIIVTAKHGQSPIDKTKLNKLGDPITGIVDGVQANLLVNQSADSASLLWLGDGSKTAQVVSALKAAGSAIGISHPSQVLSGSALYARFGNPATNAVSAKREPNIIVTPDLGTLYTSSTKKIADHGGFNHDDTSVALLVSSPGLGSSASSASASTGRVITSNVQTTQVAPTIVSMLGLDPSQLQAVQQEHTKVLPGF